MAKLKSMLLTCYMISCAQIDAKIVIKYKCETNIQDITSHEPIKNLEVYCQDLEKSCAPKCCGVNEILYRKDEWPICSNADTLGIDANYAKLEIYKSVEQSVSKVEKNFLDDFHLVQNRLFENETCVDRWDPEDGEPLLLEDGMFATYMLDQGEWMKKGPEHFCVDFIYLEDQNETKPIFFMSSEAGRSFEKELLFNGVSSVISSVFLFLVLLVYCLLPTLRNLSGMLLMAYVVSLFLTFMLRAIIIFYSRYMKCAIITGTFYFVFLSTFFWLNIMSFDIWWTFRGQSLKRAINRKGEVVKFLWYSLYGWGVPLAVTLAAAIIDIRRDELPRTIIKPMFDMCFYDKSIQYYMYAPTGLLTMIDVVLFLMTVYHISLIKKQLNKFKTSSSSTETNKNRFCLYIKMSIMMGTSWLLELLDGKFEDIPFWAYVLINLYNGLIGLVIFIMFICNKKTLKMLCTRFNSQCGSNQDNNNLSSRSNTTRSTTTRASLNLIPLKLNGSQQ